MQKVPGVEKIEVTLKQGKAILAEERTEDSQSEAR